VDCLEPLCDLVLGVFVDVSVHIHRDPDAGVAEVLPNMSGVSAGGNVNIEAQVWRMS
jgi:hypothetical protein